MSHPPASWQGVRVLVTGARGFVGRPLALRLRELGASVHAVSRQGRDADDGLAWHRADLRQRGEVRDLVAAAQPAVVFHLAGYVFGHRDLAAVQPALEHNLLPTVHLLEAVAERGCDRFVHAGSMEEPPPGVWPPVPGSPYAAAKFAATSYTRLFHALYGVPAVLARIFMVYGPGQLDENKLVPYLVRTLLAGGTARLSSGRRRVDWIHVDDVVAGLLALAARPGIDGETLDLGTGRLHAVREVAETLARLAGGSGRLEFAEERDRPLETENAADAEATAACLGWRAGIDLEEGLRRTLAAAALSPGGQSP